MSALVSDILDKAADLIEPEGAWTRSWYAKTETGVETDPLNRGASCWCVIGAIRKAGGFTCDDQARPVGRFLEAVLPPKIESLYTWNDNSRRKQAEVVAKLREAAALAREQGK
jgi:hypothetical protein